MTPESGDTSGLGRNAALRWSIGLVEPLLPTRRRIRLDTELTNTCRAMPDFAAAWFGGAVADLVRSLPDGDPWRALSATVEVHGLAEFRVGQHPPKRTGTLLPDGTPLRDLDAVTDVVEQVFEDAEIDVALAAVTDPLSPAAAALIGAAAHGWRAAIEAANALYRSFEPLGGIDNLPTEAERVQATIDAGDDLFDAGTAALRWATWRRKSYVGADDPFVLDATWSWVYRAIQVVADPAWDDETIEGLIELNRVPPESAASM